MLITASVGAQEDAALIQRLERQLRQIDSTYRLAVPLDKPITEQVLFDYGGSTRFGFMSVDNEFGSTRILRQTDTLLFAQAELYGAHRFYGRLRFLYNDFNAGDSFDDRGDRLLNPIGDRYWYQFDLRSATMAETGYRIDHNINIKGGRQFVQWGSGLTLSNTLYAGLLDVEFNKIGLIGLVGLTPASGTIDFDGSRPGFDIDTQRAYYGGIVEYRGAPTHRPYVSLLVQRDKNDDFEVFETLTFDYPTDFKYDSEYLAIGSRGSIGPQLLYRAELVYEAGDGLSNSFDGATGFPVAQTSESIEALAGLASLSYLFRDDSDMRIDFEIMGGSGDDDRRDSSDTFGGNQTGTNDTAFNSLGYVNTGLALAPEISNLLAFRLGWSMSPQLSGRPSKAMRLGVNGFLFAKIDSAAPLNVHTTDDTFVGGEIDLAFDWQITSDFSTSLRYGLFLPGDAMPDGEDKPRHFLYAGVMYEF